MKDEFKAAFDPVRAPEELKQATRQALRQRLPQKSRPALPGRAAFLLAAAACLVFLCAGGYSLYFTPTSVISIDINPSLELSVNRFDRVISAEGYNEDGVQLVESLELVHRPYEQAVNSVLNSPAIADCLAREELLTIAVVERDAAQGQEILDYVSACTARMPGASCCGIQQEEVAQAHELGLSYGKYQVYLEAKKQLPDITPEQVAAMTMRQLRELLTQEQNAGSEPAPGGNAGSGGSEAEPGNGYAWSGGSGKQYGKNGSNTMNP